MAAGTTKDFDDKLCCSCAPKKTVAITSCHGCYHHFCNKHFNEHRNQLSKNLNIIVDQHDEILQDLKIRIDHSVRNQLDNEDAQNLLRQIHEWEDRTINSCRHVADDVRTSVKQSFDQTRVNNSLTERLLFVAKELEEQQHTENFVERDLSRWMKLLQNLRDDIHQPVRYPTALTMETQDIDWKTVIKISQLSTTTNPTTNTNGEYYVLVAGEKGAGKTTFIHYVANFFANRSAYRHRFPQTKIIPDRKEIIINSPRLKQKFIFDRYSFLIDSQHTLVFLDPLRNIDGEDVYVIIDSLCNLCGISHFAALVVISDGTDIEEAPDWNDLISHLQELEKFREFRIPIKQISLVWTNAPGHAMSFNRRKFSIPDNTNFYFMQNSGYQLFKSCAAIDSVEPDFHTSMETMKIIIEKVVHGIQQGM
ncbi:unnamed protein product [Adineta steineri]|uniref:Uncharacterized protein n=2 Tax=Adineta steineri TaxID=433720 RepID=A0A814LG16_9BILA|nr:unnamed protein product [Adineta steineri]CAF1010836.1 unnamed protein product [Adineta steineri]CAF1062840.1 unnamed protein product [Adineta steineri]